MDEWNDGYLAGILAGLRMIEGCCENHQENTGNDPTTDTYKGVISMIRRWVARQQEIAEIEEASFVLTDRPLGLH